MDEKLHKIHIFMMGGTIDSFYNGAKDTVECLSHSSIPGFISTLKTPYEITYTELFMKDSRSITEDDRRKLLSEIEKTKETEILITHGTYTMPDTARYIDANLTTKERKIILTGSFIPLVGFAPSDAPFNLGFALASFSNKENGVYIAMNGNLIKAGEAIKLIEEGRFSSVFNK